MKSISVVIIFLVWLQIFLTGVYLARVFPDVAKDYQLLMAASLTTFTAMVVSLIAYLGSSSSAKVALDKDLHDRAERKINARYKAIQTCHKIKTLCQEALSIINSEGASFQKITSLNWSSPSHLLDLWNEFSSLPKDTGDCIRVITHELESCQHHIALASDYFKAIIEQQGKHNSINRYNFSLHNNPPFDCEYFNTKLNSIMDYCDAVLNDSRNNPERSPKALATLVSESE